MNTIFSLKYNGTSFSELIPSVTQNGSNTVYTLPDGLKITLELTEYKKYDARRWVLWLENTGAQNSGLITELFDCDIRLPFNDTYEIPANGLQEKPTTVRSFGTQKAQRAHATNIPRTVSRFIRGMNTSTALSKAEAQTARLRFSILRKTVAV